MKYFIFFLGLSLLACKTEEEQFADKLISTFQKYGLENNTIDWENFEQEVRKDLKISRKEGIITALTLFGNRHTFYRMGNTALSGLFSKPIRDNTCDYTKTYVYQNLDSNIGYLAIKGISINPGLSKQEIRDKASTYIDRITKNIKKEDAKKLDGWVIDLRFNSGGNMWPMLLALRPFFTQETLGHFICKDRVNPWLFQNDDIYIGRTKQSKKYLNEKAAYQLKNKNLKVAVLIGSQTASSGEAVAIALSSIDKMKYFGEDTAGLSTANQVIEIIENEYLVLTTAIMADHNKVPIENGVKIDTTTCNEGALLQEIALWIAG